VWQQDGADLHALRSHDKRDRSGNQASEVEELAERLYVAFHFCCGTSLSEISIAEQLGWIRVAEAAIRFCRQ
jgi:hypothetical protein